MIAKIKPKPVPEHPGLFYNFMVEDGSDRLFVTEDSAKRYVDGLKVVYNIRQEDPHETSETLYVVEGEERAYSITKDNKDLEAVEKWMIPADLDVEEIVREDIAMGLQHQIKNLTGQLHLIAPPST